MTIQHESHIGSHFGKLILKWKDSNPNAIRAIKKVSDNDNGFLLLNSEEKLKHVQAYKLKNFKGSFSGQTVDLSKLITPASSQKTLFE